MSYREARQLLSAMVGSLSIRIHENEVLTKEMSEQVQVFAANQTRLRAEERTDDRGRLLEYLRDWIADGGRFTDKLDRLQKSLNDLEEQFREMRLHVDRLTRHQQIDASAHAVAVGVVTEGTLAKLSETEREVLEFLLSGPKRAPEIGRLMTRSREHTARLMKSLFEQGFVERETCRQPYEYRLNDKVREAIGRSIQQQQASPPGH